ncbi:MAG TPA: immunoglobulin-like domain-containing protein [Solirubrobacteraceae bacterium]|nr:immunoglobulin-like domain-containing protein [Solirubrobacteraceae bacterium]
MRRFSFLLVAVLLAALPAAADARLKVDWPDRARVTAGDRVTVGVESSSVVRVALLRLSSDGDPVRTIKARRMRTGRFVVAVPAGRHLLVVDRAAHRRSRPIQGIVPPPAPAPVGPPPAERTCSAGRPAATLELDRRSTPRGGPFVMTVRNTGETCLAHGHDWSFQAFRDGRWVDAHEPKAWPGGPGYGTFPGESDTWQAHVFEELEPGRYRVVHRLSYTPPGSSGFELVEAYAELEVT